VRGARGNGPEPPEITALAPYEQYVSPETVADVPLTGLSIIPSAREAHRVIAWREVGETEGTGIVHIAPGCGKEDFGLGKENGLPVVAPLTMGFHGLRRTAIQFIREESDGETAGVFASHGTPVPQDKLLGLYSNPLFPRVFTAQDKVWAKLSSFMTDLGTDVMPRKFTPETIREVRRLKRQGVKTKVIAEQFGMSVNQVNRYAKRSVLGPASE
jgi:hypothetical protein